VVIKQDIGWTHPGLYCELPCYTAGMRDESANAGLCATCKHVRRIKSDRGSVFYMCQLSQTDPSFAKYPRLPVLECRGYKADEIKERSQSQ